MKGKVTTMRNEYTHEMSVTNDREYLIWLEIFRTDESIEPGWRKENKSDYSGFEVVFYWNYKKSL